MRPTDTAGIEGGLRASFAFAAIVLLGLCRYGAVAAATDSAAAVSLPASASAAVDTTDTLHAGPSAPVVSADTVRAPESAHTGSADTVRAPESAHTGSTDTLRPPVTRYARADTVRPVLLRFAGDCLLAAYYEDAAQDDPGLAFKDFSLLHDADVAMVNLECPVTTRGTPRVKPFTFRMNPRFLQALVDAGIDIVTIANNHIFDFGEEGLFDTISYLDSVGIRHVGAGRTGAEARRPVVLAVRGVKIGFLAYYGGGEAPAAAGNRPGVARRDISVAADDIGELRDSVDYIVVNLHWGTEKDEYPDSGQRAFAHALIDAGADAVIGHHPHVLQGVELYRGGIIAYSLGNFIFGGNGRESYDTGVLDIALGSGTPAYRFVPVRVDHWHATVAEGDAAARILEKMKQLSGPSKFMTKETQ